MIESKKMRRRYKTIDPNELLEADDINKTTIKGEMRIHYLGINQKLKEGGWSAKDVVAWFNDRGVPITVDIFRVYLLALDKEHGYKRSTNKYADPVTVKETNKKTTMQAERNSVVVSKFESKPKESGSNDRSKNNESQGVKIGDKPKTFEHDPSPDKDNLL